MRHDIVPIGAHAGRSTKRGKQVVKISLYLRYRPDFTVILGQDWPLVTPN